jgi:OOP family OmpA-OmpF porin
VEGIRSGYTEFARQTPMTKGLDSLEEVIKEMPGKTAVIMVSDGEHNLGDDPVQAARDIYNRYPGSVCFHVISLATSAQGQAILDGIAALRDCSVDANGFELLGNQPLTEQFTRLVFYDVVMVEEPKPEPKPAPEPKVEEVISLRNVQFDFDKSNIRSDMAPILDEAANIIKGAEGDLMLEGHTDSIGTDEYNMGLGKRRAESVKDYLTGKGVDANRLETKSFGESQPKYTNETREGRALNRRVELRFK